MTKILPVQIHREITYRLVSTGRLRRALGLGNPVETFEAAPQDNAEFLEQIISVLQEMKPFTASSPKCVFDKPDLLDRSQIEELLQHVPEEGRRFSRQDETAWSSGFPQETSVDEVAYHVWNELEAQPIVYFRE